MEVPPLDPEMRGTHRKTASSWIECRAVWFRPDGQKSPIAFRYFVQDSERNLEAGLFPERNPKKAKSQIRAHLPLFPSFSGLAGSWAFSVTAAVGAGAASRST